MFKIPKALQNPITMSAHQPVTQQEFDFPEDATLMSTTDTSSHITYTNAAFLHVSGFNIKELAHQPHNLVRHPDMPTQAFTDLWATIKAGKPWSALVKNRRKNGDHYWVRANITPVMRSGKVTGYMSVRTRPSRPEVQQAEQVYKDLREGRARGLGFHQGLLVRTGWLGYWHRWLQTMPTLHRLCCGIYLPTLLGMVGAAGWGLRGSALIMFCLWSLLCAIGGQIWLNWQIIRPIALVQREAQNVAAGQPSANITLNRVDDIGMLLRSINQSGLNLRSLVDDVSAQMDGVQHVSDEIQHGHHELSARTQQATSHLQQTATAMEQMTSSIQQNAQSAQQATELARQTSAAAALGGQAISNTMLTMQEISQASRKIGDIIGVIDSIAFQTNILALNAAVEAARAGEQGRGFAVVASEVRSLAQRSAEAARQIKQLIHDSMQKVDAGSAQVQHSGNTITDTVAQVHRVSQLIHEISNTTAEQAHGIQVVNRAIAELDASSSQNAQLAEQSLQMACLLQRQTHRLAQAVAVFKQPDSAKAGTVALDSV